MKDEVKCTNRGRSDILLSVSGLGASKSGVASILPIGARTGYGVYGCNLALRAVELGIPFVPLGVCNWEELSPEQLGTLGPVKAAHERAMDDYQNAVRGGGGNAIDFDGDLLICLSNNFVGPALDFKVRGRRNFAIVFVENPELGPGAVALGKWTQRFFAGSEWNGKVLRRAGLENVTVVPQGIDPELFFPGQRDGKFKDRFVVFSGGKMEYRKGQDLVVAAMERFGKKHPDALLVFAWHNDWPEMMAEMELGGHVRGKPRVENGRADFSQWVRDNGVMNFGDLGASLNWEMGEFLRQADVAIFPNRCEGGTNLVAMEAMACGVPCIISANTGHLDIISDQWCYPLREQGPVAPTPMCPNTEEWGESSVEEIVENLERIYADRAEARRRGLLAAEEMKMMTWAKQIDLIFRDMNFIG
jgi:glycosyltransferase involved in cell wall biosynthesis